MRHPAVDMNVDMKVDMNADLDLSPRRAPKTAQGQSMLARLHWPRILAYTLALSLWPAIIYAVSRFL